MKMFKIIFFSILILFLFPSYFCAQWQKMNSDIAFNVIAVNENSIYGGGYGQVFYSSDYGENWITFDLNSPNTLVTSIIKTDSYIIVGADSVDGIFISIDNGESWSVSNHGLTNKHVSALEIYGSNLFVGTIGGGIFRSNDNGNQWTPINNGLEDKNVYAIAVNNSNIFAGTSSGIYISKNSGTNWNITNSEIDETERGVCSFAVNGSNIFAGTYQGNIFLSTNNGNSWNNIGYTNPYVFSLLVNGSNTLAGTLHGIYLLTAIDNSWNEINEGWNYPPQINSLEICGPYILAVGNNELWRRPLSEIITSINESAIIKPSQFCLNQNYPNPFNPTTSIEYSLANSGFTRLIIYDLLGKELKLLVNEMQTSGKHTITFNASDLSSGIYLYRLSTGNNQVTKKMIIMK